jgi:hypothetical protein
MARFSGSPIAGGHVAVLFPFYTASPLFSNTRKRNGQQNVGIADYLTNISGKI